LSDEHTPQPIPPVDDDDDDDDDKNKPGSGGGNIDPDDDDGADDEDDDDEDETLWTAHRHDVKPGAHLCYNHGLAAICELSHGCPPPEMLPGNRIIGF
jgi:hypothetical protein